MRDALRGRAQAVEALAERMRCIPRILAARSRHFGRRFSEHDLADLSQDAAAAVLRKLATYAGRASLETWFSRFCVLELMNATRRAARRPRSMSELADDAGLEPEAHPPVHPEEQEEREGIERLLRHLSQREAEVVRLRHVDGLETLADVAEALGLSPSSVKTHYYRALDKLRSVVEARHGAGREGLE